MTWECDINLTKYFIHLLWCCFVLKHAIYFSFKGVLSVNKSVWFVTFSDTLSRTFIYIYPLARNCPNFDCSLLTCTALILLICLKQCYFLSFCQNGARSWSDYYGIISSAPGILRATTISKFSEQHRFENNCWPWGETDQRCCKYIFLLLILFLLERFEGISYCLLNTHIAEVEEHRTCCWKVMS